MIKLDFQKDYQVPRTFFYESDEERDRYLKKHRAGWQYYAIDSYLVLGSDGRPGGRTLGRGSFSDEIFNSTVEEIGFSDGFDQARTLHFKKLESVMRQHFGVE